MNPNILHDKPILSQAWHPVIKSAKVGAFNKTLTIAIRLITIPLLINYLGMERYGLWMTFASISAYVMILDLGIGLVLVNRLTCLYTENDISSANECISSSLIFLSMLAFCCILVSLSVIPTIDLKATFMLSSQVVAEQAMRSLTIVLIIFFLQLPFSVIQRIPYAMQVGWLSESYQILGTFISLLGIVFGVFAGVDFPVLVFFLASSQVLAAGGLLIQLIISKKIMLTLPPFRNIVRNINVLRGGSIDFMLMQVSALLIYSLQFSFLAIYQGVEEVARYGLITQALIALQIPFTVLHQPMWTRMTQLVYTQEFECIKKMATKYFGYACCYSLAATFFFLLLLNPALELVLHNPIQFSFGLRMGFAVTCALGLIAGGGCGTVLLALNLSRPMALLGLGQLIIFLCCMFYFVPTFGAVAMIWSVSSTYILIIPAYYWLIRNRLWQNHEIR